MSGITEKVFGIIEDTISPIAGKLSSQRHVMAIRDGFISAMPFLIVGSFMLVFAHPPFSANSSWAFAQWWLRMAVQYETVIMMPYNMTMGVMSIFVATAIAYNLALSYKMNGFMAAMLSLMSFLLVASPVVDKSLSISSLGGTGIFTAILVALYTTELMHFLQVRNIGIHLPEQVPPKIKQSFDLLIPVLAIFFTLYPLSLLIQSQFHMLLPEAIMALFGPIISAADTLPAILIAVLICHLLWFAGIHGAVIVGGMLQAFWLTNLGINQQELTAGQPLTHIFIEPFWQFFIVIGGSGSTMGLVLLYLRSRSAHLRSIGKLSLVPCVFNINEPVIFGSPVVMNPTLFIPFITAPLVNAVLAYIATRTDMVGRVISVVPWTTPAPIGAAWSTGWDMRAALLVLVLLAVSTLIYYPFFKIYERQLLAQEMPVSHPQPQEA
ncbi:PTS sugar transporter subunit IIC [Acerihabitans sp. TG2]|uniref:PTS sugar transporter subunit IIC n=1 Tax=Acerihabitans sp. TG2 TaxID=3096008 RepID=UPI002B2319A5|nr:PTS sugar transporter subunit IIC [Acerihabitans sp. TG2]MEA9391216.1 PTS sugar transporter subunit IIC [Acerihabitans sp. TG2]